MSKPTVILQKYEPIVEYTPLAMHKIKHLVRECSKEVGWFGSVKSSEGADYKYYLIEDIYVPKQSVSHAETDVTAQDLVKLYEEIEASGVDLATVYYWGHSHVNMAPNPSGQDENQLLEYAEAYPVFLRGIYNKAGVERMDVFDFGTNLRFDNIDADVMMPSMSDEQEAALDELIKERVTERVYGGAVAYNKAGSSSQYGKKSTPTRQQQEDFLDEYYGNWGVGAMGNIYSGEGSFGDLGNDDRSTLQAYQQSIVGVQSRR